MNRRLFISATSALVATLVISPISALAAARKGSFKGDKGHTTTGGVSVDGRTIKLEGDFFFDGAPDPRIALGNGGKFSKGTDFAKLKKNTGKQSYTIPASINPDEHDTVVLWCRKFSVPLGHAKLR